MAVVPAAPGEMLRIGAVQLQVEVPQESALIPVPWQHIQRGRRDGMKFGEVMFFFLTWMIWMRRRRDDSGFVYSLSLYYYTM